MEYESFEQIQAIMMKCVSRHGGGCVDNWTPEECQLMRETGYLEELPSVLLTPLGKRVYIQLRDKSDREFRTEQKAKRKAELRQKKG